MHEEFNEFDDYDELDDYDEFEDEDENEDDEDIEDNPLAQWKKYQKEGGFFTYEQWLVENGYMTVEKWAPIPEFDGYFEASDMGRIKNAWTGKVLKQGTNKKGYKTVSFNVLDKQYKRLVHILVAAAFIEGDHTGLDIKHKDGNITNNKLSNLEYYNKEDTDGRNMDRK